MGSLEQLQNDFQHAILQGKSTRLLKQVVSNHITAPDRLTIYRNTIIENLRNALALTFTDTWKLLGKECADSVAYAFLRQKKYFPTTQCLDDWGDKFPAFLSGIEELQSLVYLEDIAMIEWYKHCSYCAKNSQALTANKLQQSLNGDLEKLRLILRPDVFLHASNYSLQPIVALLNEDRQSTIDLQGTPSFVLVHRVNNAVKLEWLSYELFKLLYLLKKKKNTLMQAYTTLLQEVPEFNLAEALQFMLEKEVLKTSC
jgi:hypothetical protein